MTRAVRLRLADNPCGLRCNGYARPRNYGASFVSDGAGNAARCLPKKKRAKEQHE